MQIVIMNVNDIKIRRNDSGAATVTAATAATAVNSTASEFMHRNVLYYLPR